MADTVDVERGSPLHGVELTREQKLQLYRDGFIVLSKSSAPLRSAPDAPLGRAGAIQRCGLQMTTETHRPPACQEGPGGV